MRHALSALAIAGVAAVVSGCSLMSPAKLETQKNVLDKLPLEVPQQKTRSATLLVLAPDAAPQYDTTRMAYRVRPHEVDYFARHEWGATPSQMLQTLLVGALRNTHAFSAVLVPPQATRTTFLLRSEILELTQDFSTEPARVRLSLRVELSDEAAGRVIATKAVVLAEPMREKTPYAGVVAANDAVAKALQEVARFVLEKTS